MAGAVRMKSGLEIIIRSYGSVLTCDRGGIVEELRQDEVYVSAELAYFCERHAMQDQTIREISASKVLLKK